MSASEEEIRKYMKEMDGATLHMIENGSKVKTFLLRQRPNSLIMSCYLFFTPVGIIISGDISISGNGVIAKGYGLEWFSGKLSPQYLAEKFLKKKWIPDTALENWKEEGRRAIKEDEDGLSERRYWSCDESEKRTIGEIMVYFADEFPECFESGQSLYDNIPYSIDDDGRHDYPFDEISHYGLDYDQGEFIWLSVIQRKFAELYPLIKTTSNNEVSE